MTKDERRIRVYEDALHTIIDIAIDYDGYRTVEGLKSLIDELQHIAGEALLGRSPTVFHNDLKIYNCFNEVVGEWDKENHTDIYYNPDRNDIDGNDARQGQAE